MTLWDPKYGPIGSHVTPTMARDFARRRGFRTGEAGDLFCLGVDVDAFKQNCRVPMFPNQWNVWEVWATTEDAKTKSEIRDHARIFMRHVFAEHRDVAVPHMTLGPIEYATIELGPAKDHRATVARRETLKGCPFMPTVKGPEPVLVTIRFVYRGLERSWPWPTFGTKYGSIALGALGSWCPVDADWTLERAFAPIPGERVPEEGGVWQNIKDEYPDFGEAAEDIGSGIKSALSFGFSRTMFFALGAGAAAFLLWRRK